MKRVTPRHFWFLLLSLILTSAPATAEVTFELIEGLTINALSADGSAAAGFEVGGYQQAVRWTRDDGVVALGMSTVEVLGRGAGRVGISDDGLRISASIISSDSTLVTQGRWTKGLGWEQTMPPLPPDGGIQDESVGSAWEISGDGETVVGLYITDNNGRARASTWTAAGGMVNLGAQAASRDSRANATNYDGSVVAGWSANTTTGVWQPTVWESGVMTVLSDTPAGNEAEGVSSDGTRVLGATHEVSTGLNVAALWIKTPGGWQENILGALPGTFPGSGRCTPLSITDDGTTIVGSNRYSTGYFTGLVWTFDQGLMRADDYFTSLGVVLPEDFNILSCTDITPDGRVIGGYGLLGADGAATFASFIVTLFQPTSAPDRFAAPGLDLAAAVPNPFNPSTSLSMTVNADAHVRLDIFDLRGRRVRTLQDGFLSVGTHARTWDGRDEAGDAMPSGVYLARALDDQGHQMNRKLTLVK